MGIPKSTPKSRRSAMISGEIRPAKKPDWDNIGKLVCDALNGVAYDDDKCICEASVVKAAMEIVRLQERIAAFDDQKTTLEMLLDKLDREEKEVER